MVGIASTVQPGGGVAREPLDVRSGRRPSDDGGEPGTGRPGGPDAVLVPASDSAATIECLRSLGSRDVRAVVASERVSSPAFVSRFCDEAHVVPSPYRNLLAYKEAILNLAARRDVRTVVPNREVDAYLLARYREEFGEHVSTVWPPFETVRTVQDKLDLVRVADEAGVPAPETWPLEAVDDWNREVIVKARYSILTPDYVDALSPTDCEGMLEPVYPPYGAEPDAERLRAAMLGHQPIVQEYVPSPTEYALWALYDRGRPVATCHKVQHRGKTYAGNTSVYRETTHVPRLGELGQRLLDHLDWHGLASVQFLRDERDGEFKLLEINPRTWTSLPCAVRAGADFPYYYWLLATGRPERIEQGYERGVGTHLLYGELQYLASVWRDDFPYVPRPSLRAAVGEIVASVYEQPRFDYLRFDDPGPFVRAVHNRVRAGIG